MEQTFDTILTSLLESYESNPTQSIDTLINEKCKEWNLLEEQIALLKDIITYIDTFTDKATSLENAKSEGKSRKRWMLEELTKLPKDVRKKKRHKLFQPFLKRTKR